MGGFVRVGTAYRAADGTGGALWVRGGSLYREWVGPDGVRRVVRLGRHRTVGAALADGRALLAA